MAAIEPSLLVERLNWRYAVKKFDPTQKIPPQQWSALEQALVLSPSSFGMQPWRFVVITDNQLKERLVECSWGQRQVADCSHLVVLAGRLKPNEADVERLLQRSAEVRNVARTSLDNYHKIMIGFIEQLSGQADGAPLEAWAAMQVYIALGNLMTSAAMIGVDVCPMEGIVPAKYDALLGLTEQGYRTVVCAAAGYRAADDKYAQAPKVRFPLEEVIQRI